MIPSSFPESNCRLDPPVGMTAEECETLSVWRGECRGRPVVVSCWKLTQEELDHLAAGGRLWLYVWGDTMPPVALTAEHPFQNPEG